MGLLQYTQDYDEVFPRAVTGRPVTGWADAISEYVRDASHQCRSERTPRPIPGALKTRYTDYWMNKRLSGIAARKIAAPARAFLLGDGNEGTADGYQYYAISSVPPEWIGEDSGPLLRHITGANYAFADGHVKYIKADQIVSPTRIGNFAFAVR